MLNPSRLYFDAHISPDVAEALRRYEFDTLTARDANLLNASDDKHLAYAVTDQRALVTFDRDFMRLHNEYLMSGREHWGIIISKKEPRGVLIRQLMRLLTKLSAEDMKNQFRWLNDFR